MNPIMSIHDASQKGDFLKKTATGDPPSMRRKRRDNGGFYAPETAIATRTGDVVNPLEVSWAASSAASRATSVLGISDWPPVQAWSLRPIHLVRMWAVKAPQAFESAPASQFETADKTYTLSKENKITTNHLMCKTSP